VLKFGRKYRGCEYLYAVAGVKAGRPGGHHIWAGLHLGYVAKNVRELCIGIYKYNVRKIAPLS